MLVPNRNFSSPEYRYGFNGKEKDDEVKGSGNSYDYGARFYDGRVGRFLSEDPLTSKYPWYTPYQFTGNNPIRFIDLDGLEEADKSQIDAARQYYFKTILKQSDKFKNIPKGLINTQVKERLEALGNPIKQGGFYVCGPAAAAHITASHDPYNFVKTIFELYQKGFANGKMLKGNKSIYNAKPDANGLIDNIPAVDWILLNSLRYSENAVNFGSYDPHKQGQDINKATKISEFPDLLKRLGADVSITDSGSIGNSKWAETELTEWMKEKKRVVLFVNSYPYRGRETPSGEGVGGWINQKISEHYGRHFIVLKSFELTEKGKVILKYWDKGNSGTTQKVFKSYDDFKKATKHFYFIENDNAKETENKGG